jgi:hypothetical protein
MGTDEVTGFLNRLLRFALFSPTGTPRFASVGLGSPNKEKGTVSPVPLLVIVGSGYEAIRRKGRFACSNS